MLKFSKKTEYAMLALQYLSRHRDRSVPVKEIADCYGLSMEFLAKTLRLLAHHHIIDSQQGLHGGYRLTRDLQDLSVATILEITEGGSAIIECENGYCAIAPVCTIREPMHQLQQKIDQLLRQTTLQDMFNNSAVAE